MLFNSYEFIFFFLPFSFFVYFYLNQKHWTIAGQAFLVFASLFFYAWWNIIYLPLIILSMTVNYTIAKKMIVYEEKSKMLLIWGIVFNLSLLGYFKYMDFFILNTNRVLDTEIPMMDLALPLAISFYTFQQIAYLVDSYRKQTKAYSFLNYAVFVTFFPQLIAGPIVHHAEMMPQFAKLRNKVKNYYNIALGLFIFSIGLFKKVMIADTFAIWATEGFDIAESLTMLDAWVTSLSYTFQLYFDFSGYTDMAIGIALLFNIKIPMNFFSPYKARNIQDFWRRWHITLSRFLKDYIYIPLGGNRKGSIRTYTNLFTTFVLGGIWHGAGWTFVFWGMLHGGALVIHRLWSQLGFKMYGFIAWFITFNFINIAWVFFRANDFASAIKVLKGMFLGEWVMPVSWTLSEWSKIFANETYVFAWIIGAFIMVLALPNSMQLKEKFKPNGFFMLFTLLCFSAIFMLYRKSEFIYFNF